MLMTSVAVASLLFVAAITPGPNNFIVLSVASRTGLLSAFPAIFGVVVGSICLAFLVWQGAGLVALTQLDLIYWMKFLGCAYLIWMGLSLIWESLQTPSSESLGGQGNLPNQFLGVALFQALNPKTWVLLTTVVAEAQTQGHGFFQLAGLMAIIMVSCLAIWAGLGSTISTILKNNTSQKLFNIAMGGLLIISASTLVI